MYDGLKIHFFLLEIKFTRQINFDNDASDERNDTAERDGAQMCVPKLIAQ
jgi:hypothetical protein